MKKLMPLSILLMLVLAACGTPKATVTSSNSQQGNSQQGNRSTGPLPLASELVIGTLKLEGTQNAITPAEAQQLIPLWQTYVSLTTSDSTAQQEVDALVSQIQGTLTPAQSQAITDMKLTRQDEFTTMQQMGISFGGRNGATANGTPQARNGGGFGPGSGFPGGGGNFGPGGNGQQASPQQIATFQALRAQGGGNRSFANRIPTPLIDALIQYLQKTAGVATSTPRAFPFGTPQGTPQAPTTTAPQTTETPQGIATATP